MKRFAFVGMVLLSAAPAAAATIVAAPGGPRDTGAIIVSGTLQPGDGEVFSRRLMQFPKGIVVFQGDGGDLQAAIKIGAAIRLKNYATLVPADSNCSSACAVAWLGGAPRLMEDGAQIGFHAAYALKNGQTTEAGAPNALLGAYLARIGLPDRAVVYITQAPPESMTWLKADDAEKMGIEVKTIASSKAPLVADAPPDAPAPVAHSLNQQVKSHAKKPRNASVKAKHKEPFMSWMMAALRRLSAHPSELTVARNTAQHGR